VKRRQGIHPLNDFFFLFLFFKKRKKEERSGIDPDFYGFPVSVTTFGYIKDFFNT